MSVWTEKKADTESEFGRLPPNQGDVYKRQLQRTQEEFNKKYQEFQQAIAKDSLPANIAERRQKELQDMMQRQEPVSYTHLDVYKRQNLYVREQTMFPVALDCSGNLITRHGNRLSNGQSG